MSTIRDYIASQSEKASPLAKHVSSHLQDPVGATKDAFGKLSKAKLEYDIAREEAQRGLAPVHSVLQHVSQLHGLQPGIGTPGLDMNEQGGYDEMGNPINPDDGNGMPPRPSKVGAQPGVPGMPQGQVVPKKLGQASPGGPAARNSPNPGVSPQGKPFARPPKGSSSLPGAKGPGDAKVANRTKKAQSNQGQKNSVGGRQVKVEVHANKSYPNTVTIEASRSLSDLKFHGAIKARASVPLAPGGALGPSGSAPASLRAGKQVHALEQLSNKEPENKEHQVAFNPKFAAKGKTIDMCAKCGGMHAEGEKCIKSAGHSRGAKKGWSTRGVGHLSKVEKRAHYQNLDAGGPGSGRRSGQHSPSSKGSRVIPPEERVRYIKDQLKRSDKSLIDRPRRSSTDPLR